MAKNALTYDNRLMMLMFFGNFIPIPSSAFLWQHLKLFGWPVSAGFRPATAMTTGFGGLGTAAAVGHGTLDKNLTPNLNRLVPSVESVNGHLKNIEKQTVATETW